MPDPSQPVLAARGETGVSEQGHEPAIGLRTLEQDPPHTGGAAFCSLDPELHRLQSRFD
jgi:hypothetical protein